MNEILRNYSRRVATGRIGLFLAHVEQIGPVRVDGRWNYGVPPANGTGATAAPGKKTTAAACEKAVNTLEHQFQRIFADQHRTGQLDLEAVEMAIRSAVHQTGADAVTELLRFDPPDGDYRSLPCDCAHAAQYVGMRSRPEGQFPTDVQLDIDNLGDLYAEGMHDLHAALVCQRKAFGMIERMAVIDPNNRQLDRSTAVICDALGEIETALGKR